MSFSLKKLGRYDYATYLTYIAYSSCSVIVPVVLVEIAHTLQFPLESGGQGAGGALQIGRSLFMVLSMVLCGFIAGRWGKRLSTGVAVLLMGFGIGIAALAPGYGVIFLALAIAGLGEGVIEGLCTPILQDLHENDEPSRYINFGHGFWSIGIVAMTLIVGFLLQQQINWRYILAGVAFISLFPALMFLLPEKKTVFKVEKVDFKTTLANTGTIMRSGRFWIFFVLMFLGGGAEFGLTFWASSFMRITLKATPLQGAMATLIFSIGMIAGRLGSAALIPQRKLFHMLIATSASGIVLGILLAVVPNIWCCYLLFLLLGLSCSALWPSTQSYCTDRMPFLDSTVVYIILSCAGTPGCGILTWLLGSCGDNYGLRISILLIPACLLLYAALLLFERLYWHPEKAAKA
ncbi:MAG: MFS transporter [Lentisphaeria bacterium]|nr:MFS transporter [Lentisphaeria bacterium]